MLKKNYWFVLLLLAALSYWLQSCSTDVELTAPYKVTPVIVGVLDPSVDTQFVRINRTFLAPDNVQAFAQIRDSVEYPPEIVEAWLYKYMNTNLVDSIQLESIVIPSRDPGVFFDTDIRYYYTDQPLFTSGELNNLQNAEYEIRVSIDGEVYTARTDFPELRLINLSFPASAVNNLGWVVQGVPQAIRFEYTLASTGRYQGDLIMHYDEEFQDGTIVPNRTFAYAMGVLDSEGVTAPNQNFSTNSQNWFNSVGNRLPRPDGLLRIRIDRIEYRLTATNRDLNAYINASRPQSTIVPLFSTFTNFDKGAIGILGAKNSVHRSVSLNLPTLNYFNDGEATSDISFCVNWSSIYTCN